MLPAMRFLITGGAGFIGSHLADELLSRGHAVHALDDLSTGSIENIRHLKQVPSFSYTIDNCSNALRSVRTDLTDRDKLRSCATRSRFQIAGTAVTTPSRSRSDGFSTLSTSCGHDRA